MTKAEAKNFLMWRGFEPKGVINVYSHFQHKNVVKIKWKSKITLDFTQIVADADKIYEETFLWTDIEKAKKLAKIQQKLIRVLKE